MNQELRDAQMFDAGFDAGWNLLIDRLHKEIAQRELNQEFEAAEVLRCALHEIGKEHK